METYPTLQAQQFIQSEFEKELIPALSEFIKIPNQSKDFDSEWNTNGFLKQAADHLLNWANKQQIEGLNLEYIKDPHRTPFIFGELNKSQNCQNNSTIIFYGHFDKQPPLLPWDEGLGPRDPIIRDGKLYGRGSSDDGYSFFSTILCVKTLQKLGLNHPRCIFLWEGDEESGTGDVEFYIESLLDRIGKNVSLIVVLDAACKDYETLWIITNLRGVIEAQVRVDVLKEGIHSGESGILPSSFRIQRILLERLENHQTGEVIQDFQVQIPENRLKEAAESAPKIIDSILDVPFHGNTQPTFTKEQSIDIYLNQTWRAALSVTGSAGMPLPENAGNLLRPFTTLKLSIRIPPGLDYRLACDRLKQILTENPPYGATITVSNVSGGDGFNAKPFTKEILNNFNKASIANFGKPYLTCGEGGSIPFMNFLQQHFTETQFMITGVLGPNSNAHGPNEFLHLDYCKKLIGCLTQVLAQI